MIVEALASVFFAFIEFCVGLFPTGTAPDWLSSGSTMVAELLGKASGLSPWFPFSLAGTVITALFVCVAASFTIKVVRIVASFLSAGGGSAA